MRKGWTTKRLGEVGTFERGGGFLKSNYVDDGFPCIHYGQIHTTFGVSTHHHLTCIPEELAKFKSKLAKNGDVIIAITSEDVEGSCKCTAWLGGYDVAVGGHTAIFRHNLNPTFVSYYFRGRHYSLAKEKYAHGFKVVEIKPADIAKIDISYPSLSEQERIVAELDLLQGIIDKQKAQLKELDTLAQSIFYDMFGDPVENEKGWDVIDLAQVIRVKGRVGWKGYKKEDLRDNGPLAIGGGHLADDGSLDLSSPVFLSREKYEESPEIMVEKGDLILVQRGTIGKIGLVKTDIGEATINPCVLILRPLAIDSVFTLHYFLNKNIQNYLQTLIRGVAQPMITQQQVNAIQIILPPLSLQQSFATKIEAIERQKASINASIAETQKLFDYTMDKYFG